MHAEKGKKKRNGKSHGEKIKSSRDDGVDKMRAKLFALQPHYLVLFGLKNVQQAYCHCSGLRESDNA